MSDALVELHNELDFLSMTKSQVQSFISNIEETVKAVNLDNPGSEIQPPVTHHFSKGVYAREIFIPKGSFIVGKIHKFENLNILSRGDISILSIDGVIRAKAPYTVVSSPGVKRVAYAHEDCVWTTIHGTEEKDVEKIEEIFIAKSYEDVPELEIEIKKLQEVV